jgi:hypothetical protein
MQAVRLDIPGPHSIASSINSDEAGVTGRNRHSYLPNEPPRHLLPSHTTTQECPVHDGQMVRRLSVRIRTRVSLGKRRRATDFGGQRHVSTRSQTSPPAGDAN